MTTQKQRQLKRLGEGWREESCLLPLKNLEVSGFRFDRKDGSFLRVHKNNDLWIVVNYDKTCQPTRGNHFSSLKQVIESVNDTQYQVDKLKEAIKNIAFNQNKTEEQVTEEIQQYLERKDK